uniref:Uncharacterized protein isoform X2 n=2 Tax=Nicotiana TaxID=4085 RepID=A0A1S4D7W7_TOBAC|nr:PREDICTED: uncharacterized protein LOC104246836 isoform X2 [Nicotiana sylvestris]XP_016509535.1 PREDICTED: uncharacterized protein LOC107826998 isoform X2 [Nicotiana tabacum]
MQCRSLNFVMKKKSTKAKGVQASEKGGSLQNDGLATTRTPRRRLETNTMKKEDEKKDCVKLQAKQTYNEYKQNLEEDIQSQSIDDQDGPSNPSDNVDISLKVVGGVHKERAYGVGSECSFNRQSPGSPVASYSSQSSVNQGELEATRRKLQAMRKQEEMDSLQRELKEVTEMFEADFLELDRLQKLMHKFMHSRRSDPVSDTD